MAYCLDQWSSKLTYAGGTTFDATGWVTLSPSVTQYVGLFVHNHVTGFSACGASVPYVLITSTEWDALRELSVINQTLKDELAATRATIATKGDETRAEVSTARDAIAGQVNYHGQTAKAQDADFFGGAVVLFAVLVGWFIGFKWVGGN